MSAFDRKAPNFALALALVTGTKQKAAAEQLGITERTIRRKMNQPAFRRLLAKIRDQLINQALGRLTDQLNGAIDVLADTLHDRDPAIRIRAARTMLIQTDRLRASVETNDRIHDLEEQLKSKLGPQKCHTQQS